jgi:hypothetical protein
MCTLDRQAQFAAQRAKFCRFLDVKLAGTFEGNG